MGFHLLPSGKSDLKGFLSYFKVKRKGIQSVYFCTQNIINERYVNYFCVTVSVPARRSAVFRHAGVFRVRN
jgi:hypothetical protein